MNLLLPTIGFGIVTASILALAAVGLTLQFSVTGVVNFAFGDLMTLAAYTAWLVNTGLHWNVWIGAIVGMVWSGHRVRAHEPAVVAAVHP